MYVQVKINPTYFRGEGEEFLLRLAGSPVGLVELAVWGPEPAIIWVNYSGVLSARMARRNCSIALRTPPL